MNNVVSKQRLNLEGCKSIDEVRERIIEALKHETSFEARPTDIPMLYDWREEDVEIWFNKIYDRAIGEDDIRGGALRSEYVQLDDEDATVVYVAIFENYVDSGSDDYCYTWGVHEAQV